MSSCLHTVIPARCHAKCCQQRLAERNEHDRNKCSLSSHVEREVVAFEVVPGVFCEARLPHENKEVHTLPGLELRVASP